MPATAVLTSDKLAESAFALFSRHGIKDVKLDQIAARAGVTKGSLYWHYSSKHDLIQAACAHYYRVYHRRLGTALAHITDPIERLDQTLRTTVRICLLDRENRVFTTEIMVLALHDEEVRRSWGQFYDTVREFHIGLMQAAAAGGRLKAANPEQSVDFMLSTMEGIKLQALYDPRLCRPMSEKAIVANLKRILGFTEALS